MGTGWDGPEGSSAVGFRANPSQESTGFPVDISSDLTGLLRWAVMRLPEFSHWVQLRLCTRAGVIEFRVGMMSFPIGGLGGGFETTSSAWRELN